MIPLSGRRDIHSTGDRFGISLWSPGYDRDGLCSGGRCSSSRCPGRRSFLSSRGDRGAF